jgi:hypothetical protein
MLKDRIRKYLPVVLDLETGGLDNKKKSHLRNSYSTFGV